LWGNETGTIKMSGDVMGKGRRERRDEERRTGGWIEIE
jgi:hypothetical protein